MGGDKEEVKHKKRLPNGSLFLYLVKRGLKFQAALPLVSIFQGLKQRVALEIFSDSLVILR